MRIVTRITMRNAANPGALDRQVRRFVRRNDMAERVQGKIALEEHFYLPSYEAYGADGEALDGRQGANYLPDFFASSRRD